MYRIFSFVILKCTSYELNRITYFDMVSTVDLDQMILNGESYNLLIISINFAASMISLTQCAYLNFQGTELDQLKYIVISIFNL